MQHYLCKPARPNHLLEAPNVVGILPGSDPKLKSEYVIMSAHLDHIGMGRPVNGDNINNGAMDDASGVASVLEIARIMQAESVKPKRSIVFLAVAAEEKGELGSRYFAMRPPSTLNRSWPTSISICSCPSSR